MANTKSAKKRLKQSKRRHLQNVTRKSAIKTAVKKVLVAVEKDINPDEIKALLRDAESKIARARGKGVVHRNAARRKISKLAKRVSAKVRTK